MLGRIAGPLEEHSLDPFSLMAMSNLLPNPASFTLKLTLASVLSAPRSLFSGPHNY